MNARFYLSGVTTCLALAASAPQPPAAQGFGAAAPGGRGGRELTVTTLAEAGPGSLRAAATAAGPRVIHFAVAGVITLSSPIVIREPFVTIDGSTAPGDGV